MRTKKFQVSSTNNQIITNDPITINKQTSIWDLVIVIYLEFGIWDLGFFR
jgi:hypothetical protein